MVKSPMTNVTSSDNVTTSAPEVGCLGDMDLAANSDESAEFDWDSTTRSIILAAFYYGYVLSQIPAGILADRFGGKRVLSVQLLLASVLTILTPVFARTSVILMYVTRACLGLCLGGTFPAFNAMWGRWAPDLERSKLTAFCYTGTMVGNIVTFSTSGLLCQYGFDKGWGSIFYLTGALSMIWVLAWSYFTADTPRRHRRISQVELEDIASSIGFDIEKKVKSIPWVSIIKAPCVWALLIGHVCRNWTFQTMLTLLPTFMKDVLKFDIKANGALSSVPFIGMFLSSILASHLADFVRGKQWLSTTNTRKFFQSISFIGVGSCLVATGFCTCEERTRAVILLTIGQIFLGFSLAGVIVNHQDFAPKYAGVLFGITNTAASVPGMTSPVLAGYLTPNGTAEEWRNVFYVCAGFGAFGLIIFNIFASGELQEWAKDDMSPLKTDTRDDALAKEYEVSMCVDKSDFGKNDQILPAITLPRNEPSRENGEDINVNNITNTTKTTIGELVLKVEGGIKHKAF